MDEIFTTPVPEMTLEAANKKIEYLQHMIDAYMIPIESYAELHEKVVRTEKSFNVLENSYYSLLKENDQLKVRALNWINSNDEVPNDGHVVIVESGIAYREDGKWYSVTAENYPGTQIQWEVKFWMSIPSSPDEI